MHNKVHIQYCTKVMQTNFNEIPDFSWLFKEISLETLNDLIFAIRDCRLMSYADDTKLHLSHQDPQAVEDGINLDLTNTIQWFQQNGMIANLDKYQALVLGNTAHDFDIKCKEKPIPVSREIQLLGVTLDNKLKIILISHLSAERWEDKLML